MNLTNFSYTELSSPRITGLKTNITITGFFVFLRHTSLARPAKETFTYYCSCIFTDQKRASILLGLALYLPSTSVSSVFHRAIYI